MLVSFIILANKEPKKDNLKGGVFLFSFASLFKIFQSVATWAYASRPVVSQSTMGVKSIL